MELVLCNEGYSAFNLSLSKIKFKTKLIMSVGTQKIERELGLIGKTNEDFQNWENIRTW